MKFKCPDCHMAFCATPCFESEESLCLYLFNFATLKGKKVEVAT